MKNPWVTFTIICSLVLGIVLFSVVFGGYSSFIRAQKRIDSAKGLLIDQCRNQLAQVEDLAALPGSPEKLGSKLIDTAGAAKKVLDRMEKLPSPLAPGLISEYTATQVQVNKTIDLYLQGEGPPEDQTRKQLMKTRTAVFLTARQYNKAARYFNTRVQVFPGFIIAGIFGFDKIYFTEIEVDLLNPSDGKEAAGDS